MNRSETEDGRHEIVIVRRGGHDDHDDHHGGVWKIAFADFMTAMMCFFLVMWLINATNEKTKASLASYFNPVKLIDTTTNKKGIDDVGEGPQTSDSPEPTEEATVNRAGERRVLTGPAKQEDSTNLAEVPEHSDQNLFADPYAVLAEIASNTGRLQNISAKGDGGAADAGPATGASGGESYRDPFAPDFWSTQVETPAANETTQKHIPEGEVDDTREPATVPPIDALAEKSAAGPLAVTATEADRNELDAAFAVDAPKSGKPSDAEELLAALSPEPVREAVAASPQAPAEASERSPAPEAAQQRPAGGEAAAPQPSEAAPAAAVPPPADEARDAEARKLAETIRGELAQAFGGTSKLEGITVEQSPAGVMISIADDIQDGMFEIGSAVPRRDLVLAMEKIGKTLSTHTGSITINGHTDARPFSGGAYDNWRLSTARAHATYYMLVRGGLDEKRISGVAGFADRRLKRPDEPYASVNRRIEILLGVPG